MSNKLTLKPVVLKNASLLCEWYKDKQNLQYLNPLLRKEKYTLTEIKKEIKTSDPKYERSFIIYNGKTPLGNAGIDDIEPYDKRAEIYFFLDRKQQGKGYGKIIVRLLLDYAFKTLRLNTLFACATIINIPSQKVLQSAGFKRIGVRREYNYLNGKFVDEIFYDITKKDYLKKDDYSH